MSEIGEIEFDENPANIRDVEAVPLTMLVGRERPGVYVDVGIDFDGRHADVAMLEDGAERAGDDTLAHAADHTAGH